MSTLRNRFTLPLAVAMAVVTAPLLTGCFGNPIESIVEGATGGNVDLGGASVPADFPSEVPLIDGEVVFGLGVGDANGKVFTVTVKVSGPEAIDTIQSELESAGFTSSFDVDTSDGGGATAIYENETWGVLVTVVDDGENGYTATYVVTPKGA